MSTITYHYATLEDFWAWLDERAAEHFLQYEAAKTQRKAAWHAGQADAYRNAARAGREAHIGKEVK